ncbi:MAG: restriction endonuclease subunit S, partial [Longimicrobiales bacterium]
AVLNELGSTYTGLSGKTKADFGKGSPFVTYRQVFSGDSIDLDQCDRVSIGRDEHQHRVRRGDVLFTTSSETPKEVAFSTVVLDEVPELYLNSFCFGYRPNPSSGLHPKFARYLFRGERFREKAIRLAQGSTRFNISKNRLMRVALPLPPLPEQKRIAEILSSVDNAIAATHRVISQTERVKKGLLQTLMTRGIGHTRFKQTVIGEIPEAWKVVKLGEVFRRRQEGGLKGLPTLAVTLDAGLVRREQLERRIDSELSAEDHLLVRDRDLVYNTMRMWQGGCGFADEDGIVSPA